MHNDTNKVTELLAKHVYLIHSHRKTTRDVLVSSSVRVRKLLGDSYSWSTRITHGVKARFFARWRYSKEVVRNGA